MPKKHQREDCCPTVVEEPIKLPELNETAEEAAHALPRSEPKHKRARKSRKADASDSPKINAQSEGEQCEKSIVEPDEEVNGSAHSSPTSPEAAVPAKEEKRKSLKVPRKEQKEEKGPMTNLQSSAAKEQLCFYCRQMGEGRPNQRAKAKGEFQRCFNCGQRPVLCFAFCEPSLLYSGHSIHACPLPKTEGGARFATCFICKQKGHLSKDCPQNPHGIYPRGGACRICGEKTHLARDCPKQPPPSPKKGESVEVFAKKADFTKSGDEDDIDAQ